MDRMFHLCMDLEGFIRNTKFPSGYKGVFTHDDGRQMSPVEARDQLRVYLLKGWRVIPTGKCDNFDYQTGCQGHDEPAARPADE